MHEHIYIYSYSNNDMAEMYTSDVLLGVVPRADAVGHRNGDLDKRDERSDEDPDERVDLKERAND
jgi:hypothetical protein